MTRKIKPVYRTRTYQSVFFKSTLIVALCTAAVTISLVLMLNTSANRHADENVWARATETTEFLAGQVRDALVSNDLNMLRAIFRKVLDGSGGAMTVAAAYDASGKLLAATGALEALDDQTAGLVTQAMRTGAGVQSPDRFTIATPVQLGPGPEFFGTIVTRWSSEPVKAQLNDRIVSISVAATFFVVGMIMAAVFLRRNISLPLIQLRDAMARVARADYNFEVPGTARKDEIGEIASTLETFREALQNADAIIQDSIFKGAAFEGSNAALLMLDRDRRVQYVNSSCRRLLQSYQAFFKRADPAFNVEKLVGRFISDFLPDETLPHAAAAGGEDLPVHTDIRVDDRRIRLTVSAVSDAAGQLIGNVLEWVDVTEDRLNQAVLRSIDANQLRVEFLVDGKLCAANHNFAQACANDVSELVGRHLTDVFRHHPLEGAPTDIDTEELARGGHMDGHFSVNTANGRKVIVKGNFTQVEDAQGQPLRIVFVGGDVTRSLEAIRLSETKRAQLEATQMQMVAALSVGLDHLSDGDLTVHLEEAFSHEYEELRINFNQAIHRLSSAMKHVVESAELIGNEANDISLAADDLSHRTERQAATLEETAASLDELTTSAKSAAEGATRASHMATAAKSSAEKSEDVVRETVAAMDEISRSSTAISKIINVIEDIAFQTNLLALNAGVEAARAGDAGRGFAVVASEVRALAQRSSEAAQEINDLISKSGIQVKRGVGLVGQMGNALGDIVTSVSEISNDVVGIAAAVQEQSGSLQEINTAMSQLDRVTQQNAAMFEETTAASHALTSEAKSLAETTQRFKITDRTPSDNVATPYSHATHPRRASR